MPKPFNKVAAGRAQAASKAKRQRGRIKVGADYFGEEWDGERKMEELMNGMVDLAVTALDDTRKHFQGRAPRRTGRYAESWSDPEVQRYGNSVMVARLTTDVEYAPFVEFGTERSPANPAMTTAFRRNKNKFRRNLKDKLAPKIGDK